MPAAVPAQRAAEGSLGADVVLEDLTYTLRLAYLRTITVSQRDSEVAYMGSWDGYVWKTIDGGKTWDESRLIVESRPFYGDAAQRLYFGVHRRSGTRGGAGDVVTEELRSRPAVGGSRSDFGYRLDFRHNRMHRDTRSINLGGGKNPWLQGGFSTGLDDDSGGGGSGGRRGAAANANFGIGLPGGAPRLQNVVRKFGKPTAGLNIKQTLFLWGTRPTEVRIIVIHPKDPNIVFACTMFGLFMTYDGGLNWVRTFMGASIRGRMTFHVAVDPNDPKKVFLATGEGLYISEDGGQNFLKTTKKGVGEGVIDWIYFNPFDSRYVFVGTDYGLLRSSDGGKNWQWIYFTTFPDARIVRSIVIDPFDKKTGYIATHDGLFTTPDMLHGGLESWRRLGGLKFTGVETSKIAACPRHEGHLWTLTNMKLHKTTAAGKHDTGGAFIYESLDGGTTWEIVFSGNTMGSMQWFENDAQDPDMLWLVWSRALVRMRRKQADETHSTTPIIPDDPPIGEVFMAAFKYTGVEPALQLDYRFRSRLKALVPRLSVQLIVNRWQDYGLLHDGRLPSLPYYRSEAWTTNHTELRLMLTWDLSDLVFNLNASLFGRVDRVNGEVRYFIMREVRHFYGELRRLRMLMANSSPRDLRVRLQYKLRIQELTNYLNFLTGNYLARWWAGGDRPAGIETRWWEKWKVSRHIYNAPGNDLGTE